MFVVLLCGSLLKQPSWRPGMGWDDNVKMNDKEAGFLE
jgi:hypothetical protein